MPDRKTKEIGLYILVAMGLALGYWAIYSALLPSENAGHQVPLSAKLVTSIGVFGAFVLLAGVGGFFGFLSRLFENGFKLNNKVVRILAAAIGMVLVGGLMVAYYWNWLISITNS